MLSSWAKQLHTATCFSRSGFYQDAFQVIIGLAESIDDHAANMDAKLEARTLKRMASTGQGSRSRLEQQQLCGQCCDLAASILNCLAKVNGLVPKVSGREKPSTLLDHIRASLFVIILVGIFISTLVGWHAYYFQNSKMVKRTTEQLNSLAVLLTNAKLKAHLPLQIITGNTCSDCPCRECGPLDELPASDVCRQNWYGVVRNAYTILSGKKTRGMDKLSPLNPKLLNDDWGSPFLLDENQGESTGKPDKIRSAGPDRIPYTDDDIIVELPPIFIPKK